MQCFARLPLFQPCGVIPIKSLIHFPLAFAALADNPTLYAHTAVEASTPLLMLLLCDPTHCMRNLSMTSFYLYRSVYMPPEPSKQSSL